MIDFTLNGKDYHSEKEVDFKLIYSFEKQGIALDEIGEHTLELIICLVSYFGGIGKIDALEEINKHFKNGGKMSDLTPLIEYFTKSDFFQKMQA